MSKLDLSHAGYVVIESVCFRLPVRILTLIRPISPCLWARSLRHWTGLSAPRNYPGHGSMQSSIVYQQQSIQLVEGFGCGFAQNPVIVIHGE
jgi:hypothetical protein